MTNIHIQEVRLKYAYDWFEYHAKQRITMFNYFLIGTGILANAYVGSLRAEMLGVALAISAVGFFASLCFLLLDVRNHQLVHWAEDVLEKTEKDMLFAPRQDAAGPELGILNREAQEIKQLRGVRKLRCCVRHKVLIRSLEMVAGLVFLLACVYPLCRLLKGQ